MAQQAGESVQRDPQRRAIVFVAGLHKSGTSLLHDVFRRHPDASAFAGTGVPEDEGQHLQTVFPPARDFGGAGRFGADARSHLDETSALCSAGNRARLWEEWSRHWDLSRQVLVEKSPPNLVRTRFLQWMFPAASFVVIVRNPLAVTMATRKWRKQTSLAALLENWTASHERFASDRPHLKRVHVLRYETLVADVQSAANAVFAFAGLPRCDVRVEAAPGSNDAYLERWRRARKKSANDGTLTTIRSRVVACAEGFGYRREELPFD